MIQRDFSRKLRSLRESQGMTQRDLAQKCRSLGQQMSDSEVSHLETGKRKPSSPQMVQVLAQALDCSQAEATELTLLAGFRPQEQVPLSLIPIQLPTFLAHLTDIDFMQPLLEATDVPKEQLDDTLTTFLKAWRGYALVVDTLRRRGWSQVLESAKPIEQLVQQASASLRARSIDKEGVAYDHLGQVAVAERLFREAIFYAEQGNDQDALARSEVHLAGVYRNTARLGEASELYASARARFNRLGDRRMVAWVERKQASWLLYKGRDKEALELLRSCLEAFRQFNDAYECSQTYYSLGWACNALGKWDEAIAHHQKGLDIAEQLNQERGWQDSYHVLRGCLYLGDDYGQVGRLDEAERKLNRAMALSDQTKEKYERGRICLGFARLYLRKGSGYWKKAFEYAQESVQLHTERNNRMRLAQSLSYLGRIYLELARFEEAERCYSEVSALASEPGVSNDYYQAAGLLGLCELRRRTNTLEGFEKDAEAAEAICQRRHYLKHLSRLRVTQAGVATQRRRLTDAALLCIDAYQFAYSFNAYVGDEIHERVRAMLREYQQTAGATQAEALTKAIYDRLCVARTESGSWYQTITDTAKSRLDQYVFEIGQLAGAKRSRARAGDPAN